MTDTVENKHGEAVNQEGVENKQTIAPKPEVDLLDEFQGVLEKLKKTEEERDNYKTGLLRLKGKLPPEDPEILTEDEVERRAEIRAKEIAAEQAKTEAEKKRDEIAIQALKENRELKIALRNKQGVVTTPTGGASGEGNKAQDTFWTPEQLDYFKKRGIDPQKVKENYQKLKN